MYICCMEEIKKKGAGGRKPIAPNKKKKTRSMQLTDSEYGMLLILSMQAGFSSHSEYIVSKLNLS